MATIEIKDISGQLRFSTAINKGAKGKFTLMKEDYIILPFSVSSPVQFKLGDYVDLTGVLDESLGGKLEKIYEITDLQKPTYNTSTGAYDYELRMNAYYWKWKNKIFKYTPEQAGSEASWSLTASLDVQLGVFLRNLKALGYTYRGSDFTFSIDDTVENKVVAMTYDNMNLLDALFSMAGEDKWDCDCWITDNVIHFGRNEFGDAVKIERGVEASSITRSESKGTYATRIYAFGSTKNIPTNYRPTDEQAVINGVVQKRLMLPADTPYIDAYEGMSQEEAIEDVVVFDDVYPRRVGNLSDVHTRTEEIENEDGTKETVTYYRYKDTGLEFKDEYILEGQELKIKFQSGKLNGLEFGAIFNPEPKDETRGDQLWEIVRNEDYGRPLPDDMMYPADGDEYILSGFDIQLVSDQYIPATEQELKEKAQKYADKVKKDDGTYPTTLASKWVHEDPISRTYEFGQRVNLVDDTYFEGGRISRVLGWEMNLDIPWDSPVYTIGESMPYSRISEIEDKVDSLTYKGQTYVGGGGGVYLIKVNDKTAASDSNAFSALRSLKEFVRKKVDDTVIGILTFLQSAIFHAGAIFGKNGYASGMTGFGAKIDENGNAEVESLTSRRYIEAPEFRFNSIEIFLGDKWRAPGGGLIDTVDVESKTCTLKLEDGQIGAVAVGDICMGIFHSLISSDNATEDTDDSRGNRTFAGFCTVYFTITEVMGDKNEQFKYQIRPVSDSWKFSFDPFEQMKFVAYGSFTREDRQTSVYETRTYTRYLWHQNTWEIGKGNIAKQSGDLSNLNVFGLNMEGYSEYTTDVYFTGKIMQVKPDGTPVRTANDRGAWEDLVKEEGKKLCDYYDRVSHDGCLWLCVNEAGTDAEPSADSVDWLLQVDKGTDGTSFNLLGEKSSIEELPSEGNHPNDAWMVDGNLYVWNGSKWVSAGSIQGPAGASISNLGGWYSGLQVPYLGIVRMGWGSWMCRLKEGTQNPPLWIWTDSDGNRLIFAEDGQTFGYLLTGEVNSDEYTLVASDGEQGLEGVPGQDGAPGAPGQDGRTYYTWIRYADDAQGNGISDDPTGKTYIGFAYNKETPLESNNPEDYKWSDIKGTDGVPGEPGADGKTLYTWIAYSDNPDGSGMYQVPTENTLYIGIAVNKDTATEGTDPSEYTWSKFKGEDGKDGINGADGVDGKDGTSIIWKGEFSDAPSNPENGWAYKNTTDKKSYVYQDGSWYQMTIDGIDGQNGTDGLSIVWKGDLTEAPSDPQTNWAYHDTDNGRVYIYNGTAWELMVVDGTDGTDGANGQNGLSVYITYNDSETEPSIPSGDGTTDGWHTDATSTSIWMSQKVSSSAEEGTWGSPIKIKGDKGEQGASVYNLGGWYSGLNVPYLGIVRMGWGSWMCLQVTGTDNPPLWRWTDEEGNPLLFCSPGETTYGYLLTGEENNTEYTLLSRDGTDGLEGVPGKDGVPGADGKDGQDGKTYYTWIRYADTAEGIGMSDDPTGKKYIGLAYNRESPLEGNNPADYLWSLIKGEDGTDGVPGAPGADGKTYYTWIAYSDNADGSGMYQTPTSETRYIGIAVNKETAVESTDPSDYVWSKFRGDDGTGITSVDVEYALSSSRTSAPTSGWNTTAPTVTAGKYLWSRTKVTYTGGQYVYSGTACISGADGQDGADGKDGKGIASVTEQYYLSTSNTSLTGGSWSNTPPSNASGGYVWTRSLITYTDGTSNYTAALCVTGPKGDSLEILGRWYTGLSVPKNGVVTMGPSSYIAKSATTNPPLWTWTDKNGNRLMFKDPGSSTFYYLLTGEENTAQYNDFGSVISRGEDGADGKDGKGIQGITNYYLASSSSSGVTTSTSGWQTAVQTTNATKRYLWNYERITYTDGTTVNTTPAIIGMYAADGADGTDGRGIRSVREQYGVSSQQGVQPSSWQDTMPTLSATNKYLWNRETTTYTDGSTDTRTHIIAVYGDKGDQGAPGTPGADGKPGQDGKDGLPGCIIRRAEWAAGIEWRNDEALTSGTRYIDVALVRDDSTATGYRAFKCLKTHVSTDATSPLLSGGTAYWEEFGLNATALFTSLIIAKNAHLTFMQGNRLVILNEDGSAAAGFVGSDIPLWVGAENADTAPFRVTKEGKMYATDAYIEGELKAGKVGDFTIDRGIQNISDNPTAFIDIEKNGGRFFRVNREYSTGMCSIRADEAVGLAVQTYGSSEESVGVDVIANNAGRGYAIRSYGNVLLQARESESIQIHGLRMNVRAVTASGSLKKNDDFVRFAQSGGTALTITVPSASDNVGKVYYLKNTGGTVTLAGSSFLGSDGYSATTSFRLTGTNAYMMVSDGTYWCLFYCG